MSSLFSIRIFFNSVFHGFSSDFFIFMQYDPQPAGVEIEKDFIYGI